MKIAVSLALLLSLLIMVVPAQAKQDRMDDCTRVGAYIDRVANMITRAEPIIRESGNVRAISLLELAIGDLRSAQRAYTAGNCRMAYNFASQAESNIHRALRLTNIRPLD